MAIPSRHFEPPDDDLTDLIQSISLNEEAVLLTPDGHPHKPVLLNNLGKALLTRFECLGNLKDADEAISLQKQAVRLTPDNARIKRSVWFNDLAIAFFRRSEHLGSPTDVTRSIETFEKAVQSTPDGHPDKPTRLCNLGMALSRRFERLGDLGDMDRSISMFEEALSLTLNGDSAKLVLLSPKTVLVKWARMMLVRHSASEAVGAATKFSLPRFYVYQAICDILEGDDRVIEAVACFRMMQHEIPVEGSGPDE